MAHRTKLIATTALALGVALGATACSGGPAEESEYSYRIGVAMYADDVFSSQGREGMEAYAAARNIDLLWNSANNDVSAQADQIEQYVNAGVDGIVVAAVQYDSLGPQLAAAKEAGIAVATVNAGVKDNSSVDVTVVPDNVAAGRQNAQMMVDYLGGEGKVAIIQCTLGASYEVLRTQGMFEVLDQYPGIEVVAKDGVTTRTEATELAKNFLQADPDIDGFLACGDDLAMGVLQAADEVGGTYAVVGVDGTEDGLNAVRDGRLIGTQLQHGRTEFAAGLAALFRFLEGKPTEKEYYYEMLPVTPDNVDTFYKNVVSEKDAFLERLPDIVDRNLETGEVERED